MVKAKFKCSLHGLQLKKIIMQEHVLGHVSSKENSRYMYITKHSITLPCEMVSFVFPQTSMFPEMYEVL